MQLESTLKKYKFSKTAVGVFSRSGIKDLYPPQAEAIRKGVLNGRSLVMSVPTAAGKTLIAELAIVRTLLETAGRCLYIVPLKALASEKYDDFKTKFAPLGINVGMATGDLDARERTLNRFHLLIATAEKVDSLLRSRAKWLIDGLDVIVFDEIHFLNDGARGPTLEILATRIKQLNPDAQLIALSATVSNAEDIAGWLKADLVKSTWRPIPLKEGVYFNEVIQFMDDGCKLIKEERPDDLSKLVLDTLRGQGQVLVFVNSRRSAQSSSRQLCGCVASTLKEGEIKELHTIAQKILGAKTDATKICRKLSDVIRHGVAFHHAGLKPNQRKLIEENFKKNVIKVICSTPTLAAGVNLPARRAIIRDCKRFESGLGSAFIPTSEYKQCAGRAGRPQYDAYGEAILIAKSLSESQALFDRYILADPEPIISKLEQESALRIHILAAIAGGYVHDVKSTFDFMSHTFLAYQKRSSNLIEMIGSIFDFLAHEHFIDKEGFRYFATAFGQCTSRLYIDPVTAILLRLGLRKMAASHALTPIGMLHLLGCCPDSPKMNVAKSEWEKVDLFASQNLDQFVLNRDDISILDDYFIFISVAKTTMFLNAWIEEEKEETLCDTFRMGPGDIYRVVELNQWLMHAALVFADLFEMKNLSFPMATIQQRLKYGVNEELLSLTQLKGVGRIRARHLYDKGYQHLQDLKGTSVDDLAQISQIGKTLAQDILKQLKMPRPAAHKSSLYLKK